MNSFTRLLLVVLLFGATLNTFAQSGALGLYTTVAEYDGDLRDNKHYYYSFDRARFGAALSLQQYLSPSFNLMEFASFSRLQYVSMDRTAGVKADFTTLTLNLKYKFNNGYIFKETS